MLKITNARLFDPASGKNGETGDLFIENGKLASNGAPERVTDTLDAAGLAAMAGAVDIHAHAAGYPLQLLRDGGMRALAPTAMELGARYAAMGYTTVVNAALPALSARQAFLEEHAVPGPDMANLTWVGENPTLLALAARGSDEALDAYLSFLLEVSGGYGLKCINPRGGEEEGELPAAHLVERLLAANERLGLPHALHLHHPFLGRRGAYERIAETARRAEGRRLHLAHLQFYGYKEDGEGHTVSAGPELARILDENPNLTADAGAVVFGNAAVVTADAGFAKGLAAGKRHSGFASQLWQADGAFGVLPLRYKNDYMGSVQWLAGVELMLLSYDPSRIFLTTDHPNGGPFWAYPYLVRVLMDKAFRDEEAKKLNQKARSRSCLGELSRQYTLSEIAAMTRSGPARCLGMPHKGSLAVGADADIVLYRENADRARMFAEPAYVFKSGARMGAGAADKRILMAKRLPYDRAYVKGLVADSLPVPFEEAFMDDAFLAENNALREGSKG